MTRQSIENNNNTKEESAYRRVSKYTNKEINLHLVNYIKKHLGIEALKEINISNDLNFKVKDVEDIELGNKELSLKDISIICDCYEINPDAMFEGLLKSK